MKLQFLGTGGFHPNERRHTACIFLPSAGIAFDGGTGLFRLPSRLETSELDLFLSHAHLDHVCGLPDLLLPLLDNRLSHCRVHGLPAVLQAVEEHVFASAIFPVRPALELIPLTDAVALPSGRMTWFPLHHPGGSVGYRLDLPDGKSLAYLTDTTANEDAIEFARGVDVLIHECYFPDRLAEWCEVTGHSHTSLVARFAARANVGRLYLTHIDPQNTDDDPIGLPDARALFADTLIAEDLMTVDL